MSVKEKYSSGTQFNERPADLSGHELSRDELAFLAGTTAELIDQLMDLDLITPREPSRPGLFDVTAVQTVRRILRLRRHLQISLDAMALVFDLLERIEALEQRVNEMEKEARRSPG